jgi:type I restriction enzyme R subunit
MPSEAQARITINKMLEEAGWRFLPDAQGRREYIICEHRVTRRAFSPSQDLGKDFEHAPQGFVDYVLLNTDERPVAVTEAKRESIDPLTGKEQTRAYAETRFRISIPIRDLDTHAGANSLAATSSKTFFNGSAAHAGMLH